MPGFPKYIQTILVLICSGMVCVSCSSFSTGKKAASTRENTPMEDSCSEDRMEALNDEINSLKRQMIRQEKEIKNKRVTVEQLEDKIVLLEKKITTLAKNQVKNLSATDVYKKARNLLIEEDYLTATGLFKSLIEKYPTHALAGNAAYWMGECYYSLHQYKKAITVFKTLVDTYPKSGKVPGALLKTGYAYLALDDTNRAHHFLKQVLRKHPFSPAAEKAQEKLKNFE